MSESSKTEPRSKYQKISPPERETENNGGESECGLTDIDEETCRILETIDDCQNSIDALNEEAAAEIMALEQKYMNLKKPLFERRADLIEHIPYFWVTAFKNHPLLSHILSNEDEECLGYLKQVTVEELEDEKLTYSIIFHFDKNPYFSNNILQKKFCISPTTGLPIVSSSEISWFEGKDISQHTRCLRRNRHTRTFFSWILENKISECEGIAEVIKDELWMNPLCYYLTADLKGPGNHSDDDKSLQDFEDEDD